MLRKQIYLPEEYEEQLKKMVVLLKITESEIIRRAIGEYLKQIKGGRKNKKLYDLVGLCKTGKNDSSVNHDKYLYE